MSDPKKKFPTHQFNFCLSKSKNAYCQYTDFENFQNFQFKLNFKAEESDGFAAVFLSAYKTPKKIESAKLFKLSVYAKDMSPKVRTFVMDITDKDTCLEKTKWSKFISHSDLEKLTVDGKFDLNWELEWIKPSRKNPDNRLFKDTLPSVHYSYPLNVKINADDHILVKQFLIVLTDVYGGRNKMIRMFVDNFSIEKDKEDNFIVQYKFNPNEAKVQNYFGDSDNYLVEQFDRQLTLYPSNSGTAFDLEYKTIEDTDLKMRSVHYVYLYLDPRITQDLQTRSLPFMKVLLDENITGEFNLLKLFHVKLKDGNTFYCLFQDFLSAIIYVGEGKNNESMSYIEDAKKQSQTLTTNLESKEETYAAINKIWNDSNEKNGPILFHYIDNITNSEAKCIEGHLIQSIKNYEKLSLTNVNNGKTFTNEFDTQVLGDYHLYKAFLKFIIENEEQILFDYV